MVYERCLTALMTIHRLSDDAQSADLLGQVCSLHRAAWIELNVGRRQSVMEYMHILKTVVALCLLAVSSFPAEPSLVITHITIIDTNGGPSQADVNVIVRNDRIAQIEKSPIPLSGATVVDGRGKYLIPGLWDMEVHLSWATESALPILVANGVTDVMDMGGDLVQIEHWRARIMAGLLLGPNILRVGPMLNGKSFNQWQMAVGPPEEAKGVVRTLEFLGMDGLELERRVPRGSYFALIDEAKRVRIPVGGHVPLAVKPQEASDAGQRTIDNVETLFEGSLATVPKDKVLTIIPQFLASGEADSLFQRFLKNHTAVTPAISTFAEAVRDASPSAPKDARERYLAKSLRDFWSKHPVLPDQLKIQQQILPQLMQVVGRMQRDHVMLLAGTDLAGPRIPGFSLHDELAALVHAGLTPLQALQTATLNPAIVLGRTKDLGSVQAGKLADLVVLDANPLQDIDNLRRISAVVLRGKLLKRTDLENMLQDGQKLADQN